MNDEPDAIHRIEQSKAAVREIAAVTKAYYEALIDEGFNEGAALHLTAEYQNTMISGALEADYD